MSTSVSPVSSAVSSTGLSTGTSSRPVAVEPRRRGTLVLAERVVEKIAAQAATEVMATSGRSGGFLGIGSGADPQARPRVDVTLSAESADLALAVGIAYPGSIRRATQEVRDHVTERVETLTGVDVRRVDVDVTYLSVQDRTAARVLR
jgi:uncharacterized alkaline shock family protein YloU